MKRHTLPYLAATICAMHSPALTAGGYAEFDEFVPIVEINATDGDIGFHVLLDGEGWRVARIYDSDWDRMLRVRGTDDLEEQGVTELFIESAEPLCWDDPEADDDEEIVVVEEDVE